MVQLQEREWPERKRERERVCVWGGEGGGELTRDVGTSDVNIFTAITHYMTDEITAAGLSCSSGQTLAAE